MGQGAVQTCEAALFFEDGFVVVVFALGEELLELVGEVCRALAFVEFCQIALDGFAVAGGVFAACRGQHVGVADAVPIERLTHAVRHAAQVFVGGGFVRLRDDDEFRDVFQQALEEVHVVGADGSGIGGDAPEDVVAGVQLAACDGGVGACGVGGAVGLRVAGRVEEGDSRVGLARRLDEDAAQQMPERQFVGFVVLA